MNNVLFRLFNVIMAFFLLNLMQGCTIYRSNPTRVEDIRGGNIPMLEVVTPEGKVNKFDKLEFHNDSIIGVNYHSRGAILVPIPRDRIKQIRTQNVKVVYTDHHSEIYKYIEVEKDKLTGININHHKFVKTDLKEDEIEAIHLKNSAATAVLNTTFIVGGTYLVAFQLFPLLVNLGILPTL